MDPGSEIEPFLLDLVKRFDKDGLEDVLGGVVRLIAFSPGLAGGMVRVYLITCVFQTTYNRIGAYNCNPSYESNADILERIGGCSAVLVFHQADCSYDYGTARMESTPF